jgi:hypothetical protein
VISVTRVLAFCGLVAVLTPVSAEAEWQFAPFVGFTFKGDSNLVESTLVPVDAPLGINQRHWNLGGAVRLVGPGPLGVEALVLVIPGIFEPAETSPLEPQDTESTPPSSYGFSLMGNVVLTTPRSWNEYGLRPFVSGGLGLLRAVNDDETLPVRANILGYNVGGGAVGFLTDRIGLRFDLRYFRHVPPGKEPTDDTPIITGDHVRLHYWTGTIGVVIRY